MPRTLFIILLCLSAACADSEPVQNIFEMPGCSRFDGDYSRIIVPEEYRNRYDMEQRYRIHKAGKRADSLCYNDFLFPEDSCKYAEFIPPNMTIRDVFTQEEVDNIYATGDTVGMDKFALYTVTSLSQPYDLLLFNRGEMTIICDRANYLEKICMLFDYFAAHPELDERLLPLCVQEFTRIFVNNRINHDQFGPWRHWWGKEADSLGKIYNEYLKY